MSGARTLAGPAPPVPLPAAPATLRLGRPGDAHEREADRFASSVAPVASSEPPPPPLGQTAAKPAPTAHWASLTGASPGSALAPATRRDLEDASGHDFGSVRVHADAAAATAAAAVSARAFARGSHLYFGAGEYRPDSPAGRHLLAHELAHTLQGRGGPAAPDAVARQAVEAPAAANEAETVAADIIALLQADGDGGVGQARARLAALDPLTRADVLAKARAIAGPELQPRLAEVAAGPELPPGSPRVSFDRAAPPAAPAPTPNRTAVAPPPPPARRSRERAAPTEDQRTSAEPTASSLRPPGGRETGGEGAPAQAEAAESESTAQTEAATAADAAQGATETVKAEGDGDAEAEDAATAAPDLRSRVAPLPPVPPTEAGAPPAAPPPATRQAIAAAPEETEPESAAGAGGTEVGAPGGAAPPAALGPNAAVPAATQTAVPDPAAAEPTVTAAEPAAPTADIDALSARLDAASERAGTAVAAQVRTANARVNARAAFLKRSVAGKVEARVTTIRAGFAETRRHFEDGLTAAHAQIKTSLTGRRGEVDALEATTHPLFAKKFADHRATVKKTVDDSVAASEKIKADGQERVRKRTQEQTAEARAKGLEVQATYPDSERGRVQKNAVWTVVSKTSMEMEEKIPEAVAACGEVVQELPDGFRKLGAEALVGFDDGLPELLASVNRVAAETRRNLLPQVNEARIALLDEAATIRARINGLESEAIALAQEVLPATEAQIDAAARAARGQIRLAGRAATNRIHEVVGQAVGILTEAEEPDPEASETFVSEIETFADGAAGGAGDLIGEIAAGVGSALGKALTDAETALGKIEQMATERRAGLSTGVDEGLAGFVTEVDRQLGVGVAALKKVYDEKGGEIDKGLAQVAWEVKSAFEASLDKGRRSVKKMLDDALHENDLIIFILPTEMRKAAREAAWEYDHPVRAWIGHALAVIAGIVAGLLVLAAAIVIGILAIMLLVFVGIPAAIATAIVIIAGLAIMAVAGYFAYESRRRQGQSVGTALLGAVGHVTGITQIIRGATRPHLTPFERSYEITQGVGTLVLTILPFAKGRAKRMKGRVNSHLPESVTNPTRVTVGGRLGRVLGIGRGAAGEAAGAGGRGPAAPVTEPLPPIEAPPTAPPRVAERTAPPGKTAEPTPPTAEVASAPGRTPDAPPRAAEGGPAPGREPAVTDPGAPPRAPQTQSPPPRRTPEPRLEGAPGRTPGGERAAPPAGRTGGGDVIPFDPGAARPPRPARTPGGPDAPPGEVVPLRPARPARPTGPATEPPPRTPAAETAPPKPNVDEADDVVRFVEAAQAEAATQTAQRQVAAAGGGGGGAGGTVASIGRPPGGGGRPPVQPQSAPPLQSVGGGRTAGSPPGGRGGRGAGGPDAPARPPKPDVNAQIEAIKRAPPEQRGDQFAKLAAEKKAELDRINESAADLEKQVAKLVAKRDKASPREIARERYNERIPARQKTRDAKIAERDAAARELARVETQAKVNDWDLKNPWPCFAAGTPVWTEDGPRPIEAIAEGDRVWAYDFAAATTTLRPVQATLLGMTDRFYHLSVAGQTVQATGAHPFWAGDPGRWLPARELVAGARLRTLRDGGVAVVAGTQAVEVPGVEPTFNLSVAGSPSFFVGPGVLVHNESTPSGGSRGFSFGDFTVYEGTFEGTGGPDDAKLREQFKDHVYEGRTKQDITRRQEAHRRHARIMLRRTDLTPEMRQYYEFKKGIKLRPRLTGLNETQSIYFEQLRLNLARQRLGPGKVMFRREEATPGRFRQLFEAIRTDPRVRRAGLCP